jgi:hypothetical protein
VTGVQPAWKVLVWRWPWITMIAAVVLAVSPPGQEVVLGAFFAGDRLTRHLSLLVLAGAGSIAVVLALAEWFVRYWWQRRRQQRAAAGAAGAGNGKTET